MARQRPIDQTNERLMPLHDVDLSPMIASWSAFRGGHKEFRVRGLVDTRDMRNWREEDQPHG